MKKALIPVAIIVGIILIFVFWIGGMNNTMVELEQSTTGQWANVESSYQRRADLIPNIVNTAKGYAEFEQETLTQVIEARAKATSVQVDPSEATPEQIAEFQQAQSGVSSALSRLMVTVERYPELRANENFKELINELERTENRINVERNRFNGAVQSYNTYIKKFPNTIAAGLFGFDDKGYFEADEGASTAPQVDFSASS